MGDKPPGGVLVLAGLQHVALMSMDLVYPVLLAQATGASAQTAAAMVSLTLVAMAIGTLLQVIGAGPAGSRFLCQPSTSVIYLVPSLLAAKMGGLPLVFGMTVAAGAAEVLLSRAMKHMRSLLPPEISGLVVLLIGVATGIVGLRSIFGAAGAQGDLQDLGIGFATVLVMLVLNIWSRGMLRLLSVLIGMVAGYTMAVLTGRTSFGALDTSALVALPQVSHLGWSFEPSLLIPFGVAAIAATLKVTGNVTTSQRANDSDWKRPDLQSVSRGVLADGLATMVAGGVGASGLSSSTSAVGLAAATGVLSRRIGYAIAAMLLVLAFVPRLGMLFYLMPRAVAGAALVFSSTFIVVNGLEIITSRLLDARKTIVIGFALVFGLAVDIFPAFFQSLPAEMQTLFGTSMAFGTITALGLNALFRIGVTKRASLVLPVGPLEGDRLYDFMEAAGQRWGARRDVIERAQFNLTQSVETIIVGCSPQGPLQIDATFDEFNLEVRVSYVGAALELPEQRPSKAEIIASEEGERKLAGYMLRRYADRVTSTYKAGRSAVLFHFNH
ncbi:MAG: purine/pyrimidine permease [Proteobacteria bacterium]|nr:purine/pyrimidine permease [Pseudomonadota bacterium]